MYILAQTSVRWVFFPGIFHHRSEWPEKMRIFVAITDMCRRSADHGTALSLPPAPCTLHLPFPGQGWIGVARGIVLCCLVSMYAAVTVNAPTDHFVLLLDARIVSFQGRRG